MDELKDYNFAHGWGLEPHSWWPRSDPVHVYISLYTPFYLQTVLNI